MRGGACFPDGETKAPGRLPRGPAGREPRHHACAGSGKAWDGGCHRGITICPRNHRAGPSPSPPHAQPWVCVLALGGSSFSLGIPLTGGRAGPAHGAGLAHGAVRATAGHLEAWLSAWLCPSPSVFAKTIPGRRVRLSLQGLQGGAAHPPVSPGHPHSRRTAHAFLGTV